MHPPVDRGRHVPGLPQESDDLLDPAQGKPAAGAARDHQVRAAALLPVGHLPVENAVEPDPRHPGPRQDARFLQEARRRHHQRRVAPRRAAGLEQQRDVQHDEARAAGGRQAQEPQLGGADQRMQDAFEHGQGRRIAEHPLAQRAPVDRPGRGHAGEGAVK